jgi:hypothetical protein
MTVAQRVQEASFPCGPSQGEMWMQVRRDTEAAETERRQLQLRASLLANELSNLNNMLQQRELPIITYKYQPVQGSNRVRRTSHSARKALNSESSRPSLGAASMATADSYGKAAKAARDDLTSECRDVATSTSLLTSPIHAVKDVQGAQSPVYNLLNHAVSSLIVPVMEQNQVRGATTQSSGLPVGCMGAVLSCLQSTAPMLVFGQTTRTCLVK